MSLSVKTKEYDFSASVAALSTTAVQAWPWKIADTSSAGTPTYTLQAGPTGPEAALSCDSQNEVQNVCLYQNDFLQWDIDCLLEVKFRVRLLQASFGSAMSLAFGLCTARNDAIDSLAAHASFRLLGSTAIWVESDDGVTDVDDIASGVAMGTAYRWYSISFTGGKSNVLFTADGQPAGRSSTFNMSGYSGALQPYMQLQKTAAATAHGAAIDRVVVEYRL